MTGTPSWSSASVTGTMSWFSVVVESGSSDESMLTISRAASSLLPGSVLMTSSCGGRPSSVSGSFSGVGGFESGDEIANDAMDAHKEFMALSETCVSCIMIGASLPCSLKIRDTSAIESSNPGSPSSERCVSGLSDHMSSVLDPVSD